MEERVKEQEFEEGFLHGWDGSECIYYTDEKCLYYNDAEAPCHHCHHYTRKTQQKRERIAENYLETRNKVIENCWRMIVGNDTPKQEDGWLEVMNDRKTENGIANIYNFMYKGRKALTLEEVQGYGAIIEKRRIYGNRGKVLENGHCNYKFLRYAGGYTPTN